MRNIFGAAVLIVASLALVPLIGGEFAPPEDMSMFMISIEAPVGISLPAMDAKMQQIERIVLSQPEILGAFAAVDLEGALQALAAITGRGDIAETINYRVCRGDTVSSIAKKYGKSTRDVLRWNGLAWNSRIYPGDVIQIRNM
mgnify:CR=1 FL=1